MGDCSRGGPQRKRSAKRLTVPRAALESVTVKESTHDRKNAGPWLAAGLIYAAAAVLVTWPLAQRMITDLPGPSADSLLHYWNGWWVRQALLTGSNPYRCELLFFPNGVSLATHNLAWWQIALWLPIQAVLGGLAAYNLALLVTLVACGLAAHALVLEVVGDRRAALVAGLIYLAWPFRISQLDHPNLVGTMLVPLLLLGLMRLVRRPRLGLGLLVGICAAGVGLARWQALIPAGLLAGVWLVSQGRRLLTGPTWRALAVAGVVAALLLAPFAFMLFNVQEAAPTALIREEEAMQTDLLAWVTPPSGHPLFGQITAPLYDRYYAERTPHRRVPMYVGVSVSALGIVGVVTGRRKAWPWAIIALLLGGLALGSTLRVGGREIGGVHTLYGLLAPIRVFRLMREPDRYGLFVALPMAVLAGQGLAWLLGRARLVKTGWVLGVTVLAAVIVLGEYLQTPVPTQHPVLSPYYAQLRADPDAGAVLDVPLDTMQAKWYMFAQTMHQRPIVVGNLSRLPSDALGYVTADPWLSELAAHQEMPPWQTSLTSVLGRLYADGVTHIVLHKNRVGADRIAHWRRYLAMQPLYEDEQIVVYTTAPRANQQYAFTPLWDGLGPVDVRLSADCQRPGDIVTVDVVWGTSQAVAPVPDVRLVLEDATGASLAVESCPLLADGRSTLQADALEWGSYALRLPSDLPSGSYALVLDLGDDALTSTAPCWGQVRVQGGECPLPVADGLTPMDATFGHQLRLLGYALERSEGALQVRLLWRAEQRMPLDYTVFVHLYDLDTGIPVSQDDAMPRRGALPTRFWMAGQMVDDQMTVPLPGVAAGTYGVLVGVYDGVTGDRLPVQVGADPEDPDGRLVLTEAWEVP